MNLGELEFKLEDFNGIDHSCYSNFIPNKEFATALCERANTILREKLAQAPEVFGFVDEKPYGWTMTEWPHPPVNIVHRARLVCIEEIKK